MSWASDKAREVVDHYIGDHGVNESLEEIIERAILETIARIRSEVADASKGLPEDTRIALDAAIKGLGEP